MSAFIGGRLLGAITSFLSWSLQTEAGKTRVYVTGPWGQKQSDKATRMGPAHADILRGRSGVWAWDCSVPAFQCTSVRNRLRPQHSSSPVTTPGGSRKSALGRHAGCQEGLHTQDGELSS